MAAASFAMISTAADHTRWHAVWTGQEARLNKKAHIDGMLVMTILWLTRDSGSPKIPGDRVKHSKNFPLAHQHTLLCLHCTSELAGPAQ